MKHDPVFTNGYPAVCPNANDDLPLAWRVKYHCKRESRLNAIGKGVIDGYECSCCGIVVSVHQFFQMSQPNLSKFQDMLGKM